LDSVAIVLEIFGELGGNREKKARRQGGNRRKQEE